MFTASELTYNPKIALKVFKQPKGLIMKRLLSGILATSMFLASCASSPDEISASYVSPAQYHGYNCNQIRMEMQRVSRHVNQIAGHQQDEADGDAAAMGVGLILFWPALFFMIGDDKEEELARLKGEYEALEIAAIDKECNVADEIQQAREMREKRQELRKEAQEEFGQPND